jgi:predicted RNA-binding protein with PUA-like domain
MTDRAGRRFWLMKSEPDECSIDDALAAPERTVPWVGVRNYQARNFMRDAMRPGDGVLFWHSGCEPPGIAGLAEVAGAPYPDPTQFDPASPYFDASATRDAPRWILVDVRALRRTRFLTPAMLREHAELADMQVLRRGNRLSITPVTPREWAFVAGLLGRAADPSRPAR